MDLRALAARDAAPDQTLTTHPLTLARPQPHLEDPTYHPPLFQNESGTDPNSWCPKPGEGGLSWILGPRRRVHGPCSLPCPQPAAQKQGKAVARPGHSRQVTSSGTNAGLPPASLGLPKLTTVTPWSQLRGTEAGPPQTNT